MPLILILHEVGSIHDVELAGKTADIHVAIECNAHLTGSGRLGGNHHNAVTTLGTIDSSEGSILQNIDGSDV